MTVLRGGISSIQSMYKVTLQGYETLYVYRFIMPEFSCIIRRNPAIKKQYMPWIHSAIFVGDFWVSSAEFLYMGKEADKVKTYHHFFMNLTIPYLTEKGVEELKALL